MELYSVRDTKAKTNSAPFNERTHVHATRAFATQINNKDQHNMLYNYPEHFDLYHIGTFDEEKGELNTIPPNLIATGISLQKEVK